MAGSSKEKEKRVKMEGRLRTGLGAGCSRVLAF